MKRSKYIVFITIFTIWSLNVYSQTNYWTNANGTGVWSDLNNWSLGNVPDGTEGAIGFDATLGAAADCFIDVAVSLPGEAVTISSNYTNAISCDNTASIEWGTLTMGGGSFTMGTNTYIGVNITFGNGSVTRTFDGSAATQINLTSLSMGGTGTHITFKASSNTSNGTILTGNLTYASGSGTNTFTNSSGRFNFSTLASRTIPALTFYQLVLNNTNSGGITFTLTSTVTVTNKLILMSSAGSTTSFATGTINLNGDLDIGSFLGTTAGTYTGTINFNGSTTQNITGAPAAGEGILPTVTINHATQLNSGYVTFGGACTNNSTLTTSSGNVNILECYS